MLAEGVGEHWASGGRGSRNLPGGEPRPRTVAGKRGRVSQQGPGPGEADAARGTGGWGISTPWCLVQTSLSLGKAWEGEDKDHLANKTAFPPSPPTVGWGHERKQARGGPSQDLNQDSGRAPTPVLFPPLLATFLGTRGGGEQGPWSLAGQHCRACRERPDPALRPWSHPYLPARVW